MIVEGMEGLGNDYFIGIRRHWMLIHWSAQEKDIVQFYNHYSTTPLLMCAVVQDNNYADDGYSLFKEW